MAAIWNGLRGLRKDNTGYDLKQLFIGAEGTLGVVTAAVLKLYPAPKTRVTAFVAMPDVAATVRLLHDLRQALGDRITGFELMSALSIAVSRKHQPALPDPCPGHPWYALIQVDDTAIDSPVAAQLEQALGAAIESGVALDAVIAQSGDQARALWQLRENIAEAQRREGPNIKHDISLPVSAIPRFLDEARVALVAALPGVRFVTFGHLGDGNLHYNLAGPEGRSAGCVHGERAARESDRPRSRRRLRRQHQRRARDRPAEARRARPLQERDRARPDARRQGGVRPGRNLQSGQGALKRSMAKLLHLDRRRHRGVVRPSAHEHGQGEAARRLFGPRAVTDAAGGIDGSLRALRRLPAERRRQARPGRDDLWRTRLCAAGSR